MYHADTATSTHTIRTMFGTFYVCSACLEHMPRTEPEPRRHPDADARPCQCENICHDAEVTP